MNNILSDSMASVEKKSFGINQFVLKIIAYVFMLCDLIGIYILETHVFDISSLTADGSLNGYTSAQLADLFLRMAGGIAFPLFCFLIVQGFLHTSDVKKYVLRIAVCSVATEFIWDMANDTGIFCFDSQSPLFTLLLGLLVLIFTQKYKGQIAMQSLFVALGIIACSFFNCQFGTFGYGVILIVFMYFSHEKKLFFNLFGAMITIIASIINGYLFALLAFVIIALYNGKRGPKVTYSFYFVYPVSLLILHFAGILLF